MIAGWFAGAWAKIVAVGAILLAILVAIRTIWRKGEVAGEAKVTGKINDATTKTQAAFDRIDSAPDSVSDALGKLRGRSGHTD